MYKFIFTNRSTYKDLGLFVIRLGIGLSLMFFHGLQKIKGGPELWTELGSDMSVVGINFLPVFWGFMAGFAEFFCSLFLILGIFFRPAALLLVMAMVIAVLKHLNIPEGSPGAGWLGASHALELMIIYIALILTGPGKYKV
jgi:putative oxidoreductase